MSALINRTFEKKSKIHVIDWWGSNNGNKVFVTEATILEVNNEDKNLIALLYGDTYIRYKFKDYGRLFFDTKSEASSAAHQLPEPRSLIFQIIGKKVYSKILTGIRGKNENGAYDLFFEFDRGKGVSIKELEHTVFSSREVAKKHLADMQNATTIFENKSCTCCKDVFKVMEIPGDMSHTTITLYKNKIIDTSRDSFGWCYYLTSEDDEYPIILTEDAASDILKFPKKAVDLVNNRWLDRYK